MALGLAGDAIIPAIWRALRSVLPSELEGKSFDAATPGSLPPLQDLINIHGADLEGINITKLTTRALRLHPPKAATIAQISPDGKFFPSEPAEFLGEVRRQASELYGARHPFHTGAPCPS